MPVDMTRKPAPPVAPEAPVEPEAPKEQVFSIGLTKDEIATIKNALMKSKDIETYISTVEGAKQYKLLASFDEL